MANSVHFGRGAHVETIIEAIQRVGMLGVHELVTYAVASQLVGRPLLTYRLDSQSVWYRAVACAIAAGCLADNCEVERGDAYTAGLMHGLGLVVIDRYAAKERGARIFPSAGYPEDFAPAERAWLNFSHAEAGSALLELWGFSEGVVTAVRPGWRSGISAGGSRRCASATRSRATNCDSVERTRAFAANIPRRCDDEAGNTNPFST
jgi:HD-like signal output (HDOD) protein